MTKKNYIAIAQMFKDAFAQAAGNPGAIAILDSLVKNFSGYAKSDNVNFQPGKFHWYIYGANRVESST